MSTVKTERYAAYKATGVEWLGEIPSIWQLQRHKNAFQLISSRCLNPDYLKVGLENIEGKTGRFISSDSEFEGDGIQFKRNDILFGKLRPYLAKVYLAEFSGNAIGDIFVYRSRSKVSPQFAAYLMRSDRYIDVINSSTAGAKMPRASSGFIADLPVAIPSLNEQIAIAAYLDTKTAQIDSHIDLLSQKAMQYGELKQSLISEIVTRGLVKSTPMRDSGVEWIGGVPEHWEIKRGKDIFEQTKNKAGLESSSYDVLSLTLNGVIKRDLENMRGKIPASFDGYQIANPGDLVLCLFDIDVTPRIVGYVNNLGIITSAYTVIKGKRMVDMRYFLYYYLEQNRNGSLLANSKTLRSTMTFDLFSQLLLPVPPLAEQRAIANYLDERTTKIDQIITTINDQIIKLKDLRKALINDVVTGKIKVVSEE